jgi:hypothetical protein
MRRRKEEKGKRKEGRVQECKRLGMFARNFSRIPPERIYEL